MLSFVAFGTPRPQGSKRYVGNGRFVEASDVKPWRAAVARAAETAMSEANLPPFDQPVVVSVVFFMPRPKTVKRMWPSVVPDTDKLCRAIGDALSVDTKAVMADDSLIVKWNDPIKVYADTRDPGVWVSIRPATIHDLAEALQKSYQELPEDLRLFLQ
jgi:Holliday junction resolvase RusA-like endonuclease